MNQLHVIGPPPSKNDCLGFLGCFKDSRYANNGLYEECCNGLHSIGIEIALLIEIEHYHMVREVKRQSFLYAMHDGIIN